MDSSSMISTNYTSKLVYSFAASEYSCDQESGWSFYLDDASDYASSDVNNEEVSFQSGCKKAVYVDHDLEDTASSPPPHSPQQSDDELNQLYMKTKQMKDIRHIFQEYDFLNLHKQEEHEGIYFGTPQGKSNLSSDEMELVGRERSWTELGRKGLCLVPLSMLFKCVT